jgi:hypothetical protein
MDLGVVCLDLHVLPHQLLHILHICVGVQEYGLLAVEQLTSSEFLGNFIDPQDISFTI